MLENNDNSVVFEGNEIQKQKKNRKKLTLKEEKKDIFLIDSKENENDMVESSKNISEISENEVPRNEETENEVMHGEKNNANKASFDFLAENNVEQPKEERNNIQENHKFNKFNKKYNFQTKSNTNNNNSNNDNTINISAITPLQEGKIAAGENTENNVQKTVCDFSNETRQQNVQQPETKIYGPVESIELNFLKSKTPQELIEYADGKIENIDDMYRQDMISAILKNFSESNPENTIIGDGVLEIIQDGYGFLRYSDCNYSSSSYDIYVSHSQIKKFALRTGDCIKGTIKAPKRGEKYFSLIKIDTINDLTVERSRHRSRFDDLVPLYPDEKLNLENEDLFKNAKDCTCRVLDMLSPIGKGQRALVVAPPKAGKTTILQNIAHAIAKAHPEVYLMVLLIDERPEEVTDMERNIKGEVVSSTFDEPATRHVQLAEMAIEKAKRIVETGKDVVILLDSITRLARAYNNVIPSSGKVLTGGVDANALQKPKRFFGAARNIENGGSLTIIATALVETGSKMDEVIFEEFKGTGNSEILLDRKLADKRIFPAVDIIKSGTRREELLLEKSILTKTWMLRKILSSMDTIGAMEFLKEKLDATKNNMEFFNTMNS